MIVTTTSSLIEHLSFSTLKLLFLYISVSAVLCNPVSAAERFADSHIHFNWNHQPETSAEQVIDILKDHDVGLAIVTSTPSSLALELRDKGGDWIIPFFSPYIHEAGKRDWYLDKTVIKHARDGLEKGLYFGIGEVHFMNGFKPRTDNAIFQELISLAREYDVPMMIHIDSGSEQTFLNLCRANPEIRLVFAHAGGNLRPSHIETILKQCPSVWIDFAARDPWRYNGISKENFTLLPDWKSLVLAYPDHFITGTDPVWKVTRWSTWDTDDEGWTHYQKLYDYHWTWLNDLPTDAREKIAWKNTHTLLKRHPQ